MDEKARKKELEHIIWYGFVTKIPGRRDIAKDGIFYNLIDMIEKLYEKSDRK